jgi:ribosomal protein S19
MKKITLKFNYQNNILLSFFNLIREKEKDFKNKIIYILKTDANNLKITKWMVGLNCVIYNGKYYIPCLITELMVGDFLGNFAFSKPIFLKKQIRKRKKKKK